MTRKIVKRSTFFGPHLDILQTQKVFVKNFGHYGGRTRDIRVISTTL